MVKFKYPDIWVFFIKLKVKERQEVHYDGVDITDRKISVGDVRFTR